LAGFPEVGGIKVMSGKESIAIDVSTPEGKHIVLQLIGRADAVLQGFRAGAAEKLGLDSATLRATFPDLVCLDATGYGPSAVYGDRPAHANSIAAAGGVPLRNAGDSLAGDIAALPDVKRRAMILGAFTASRATNADGLSALAATSALTMALLAKRRG